MALDKQRILSELGSVMNQLQSADCGCMGKLFSGSGQGSPGQPMGAPLPTCGGCRRGCCQGHGFGGYGGPCAGDAGGMMGRPCMGRCNPPKLYADTYSYLNQNLMQPVVKEVYDDLRSISPANTIGNNPLANQMGLGNAGNPNAMQNMGGISGGGMGNPNAMQNISGMPGGGMGHQNGMHDMNGMPGGGMGNQSAMQNMGGMPADTMGNPNAMQNMGGMPGGGMGNQNAMQNMGGMPGGGMENSNGMQNMGGMSAGNAMENPNNQMGGMGAQIVNMMMSGGGGKPSKMPAQGGQLTEPMLIDAPYSPHGQVGVTPLSSSMGRNQGQFGAGNMGMSPMGQGDPNTTGMSQGNQMASPQTQYVTQDNMFTVGNAQASPTMTGNMVQNMNPGPQQPGGGYMNQNPAAQQISNAPSNSYGLHAPGVTKFNQMFPGVMQGDLGFDPMAIAIQMNPANQQKAAMNTMQKLMGGKTSAPGNTGMMQSAVGGANMGQPNQLQQSQSQAPVNQMGNQQISQSQQNFTPTDQIANQQMLQGQQQIVNPNTGAIAQPNQQQVYTSRTGAPTMQQMQGQQAQQQMVDPNTGAVRAPTGHQGMSGDPNAQMQQLAPPAETAPPQAQEMYKEPIFPADTSRNPPTYHMKTQRNMQYNTLGQPVELLPGSYYHTPEPGLPQTLSPQPVQSKPVGNLGRLGVKSTVSKTSLMGNRPAGSTPSRSQLQHVYHQYKGSQSFTQQNVRGPMQSATHSDGKLNAAPANAVPTTQIPVEKVGGDTSANNQMNDQIVNRVEEVKGQMGDVPATNKPNGDAPIAKMAAPRYANLRNGLQDMTYTSQPSNAAWSFHGEYYPPGAMASFYRSGNRRR